MHYCPSCGYNITADPEITIDGYTFDPTTGLVVYDNPASPLELSRSEFYLLYSLAAAKGRVLEKGVLALRISDGDTDEIVNVFAHRVRAKLKAKGWPNLIETIWGRGFRWAPGAKIQQSRGGGRPKS